MRTNRFVFAATIMAQLFFNGALLTASQAAPPKDAVLINFSDSRRDRDGTIFHPYEYAWNDWDSHVSDLPGRGVLVKAPSGKGVLGENKTLVGFADCTLLDLVLVIGSGNHAKALSFSLEDKDGTAQTWNVSLADKPAGREIHAHIDLNKSDGETSPGKVPGMNLKKIVTWQIKGDYGSSNVEVLLLKLVRIQ